MELHLKIQADSNSYIKRKLLYKKVHVNISLEQLRIQSKKFHCKLQNSPLTCFSVLAYLFRRLCYATLRPLLTIVAEAGVVVHLNAAPTALLL